MRFSSLTDGFVCPVDSLGGPEFTSTRDSPVCDVVRRSTRTMCREGRVAVRCLPRYVRGGSKYCVNSHGRKCMGRIYTDTRGRGVPIMRCQPYYATIILRAEIRGDRDASNLFFLSVSRESKSGSLFFAVSSLISSIFPPPLCGHGSQTRFSRVGSLDIALVGSRRVLSPR